MNKNAIGVFDSGLGGLTAVKEMLEILPNEDIVYFGDTSRVPYGAKSRDTIIRYARQDLNFLSTFGIKAALVACGTVSAVAIDVIKDCYPFAVIGVIDSTVKAAISATRNKKIGIIGTPATVRSDAYSKLINKLDPDCETITVACPLFVPLVENGHTDKNDPITKEAVKLYLSEIKAFGADTLILGCTHYPILSEAISDYMGQGTMLINSGREAAKAVREYLEQNGIRSDDTKGTQRYFVSDSVEQFESLGGTFINRPIEGKVAKIDIERY
ncbi:MAG: glutamate racemase [Clostridia bacterium]|nr:glutamate racemase [Clostridia bacterium]